MAVFLVLRLDCDRQFREKAAGCVYGKVTIAPICHPCISYSFFGIYCVVEETSVCFQHRSCRGAWMTLKERFLY